MQGKGKIRKAGFNDDKGDKVTRGKRAFVVEARVVGDPRVFSTELDHKA